MKKYLLLLLIAFPFVAYGASSVFQPFQGGTGNGNTPTYGNVLVGNSSGTYTLTATSSLGLLSPVLGTTGQNVFMSATNTLGATSTIFITSSSTVNIGTTTLRSIDPNHPAMLLIDTGTTNTQEGLEIIGSVNDFLESNIKNTSTGANAQACSTVTSNGGSNTTNFLSICANNTNFYNPQIYNVGGANDNSLMSLSSGGLYITQGTAGQKLFFLNGGVSTSTNIAMTISGTNVGIGTTSPSQPFSLVGAIFASSTTATSTFFGKGINLITSAGDIPCFAVNGTCITSGGGSQTPWTSDINGGGFSLTNVNIASSTSFRSADGAFGSPAYTFGSDTTMGIYRAGVNQLNIKNNSASQIALTAGLTTFGGDVTLAGTSLLKVQNGTAIAPTYTFASDATTGIYRPALGVMAMNTLSKERVRLDFSGRFGIGTTTPFALLSIHSFASGTSTVLFAVGSSTASATTTLFGITNTGHFFGTSTSPVLSSCGTAPSVLGSDSHGEVTTGATANGCTITFAQPYVTAPACVISNQSMSIVNAMTYTISTTALTITQTGIGGGKIDYICMQN